MFKCAVCGSPVSAASDRCLTCGADVGAPNVRAAADPSEASALEARFQSALARAGANGTTKEIDHLKNAMARTSAVVNCDLPFLRDFVTRPTTLYANYHRGVLAEVRKAAEADRDRDRVIADAVLFGSYSGAINMAALSLTDTGLSSYGPYSMKLRDLAVASRASLLDENSYTFVSNHRLTVGTPIPLGHRSTWKDRAILAVAKLADFITIGMDELSFRDVLLRDSGARGTDSFIEVHIFGTFDREAIESVCGPKLKQRSRDRAIWEVVKEHLTALGKSFREL